VPRIIRVFPRRTKATPDDALAYFGAPDQRAEADEVHVSVTFTYDKAWAEHLAEKWRHVAPVKIGGVAYGDRGEEFVPGRYIKPGYIFTSRGCPRRISCAVSVTDRTHVTRTTVVSIAFLFTQTLILVQPGGTALSCSVSWTRRGSRAKILRSKSSGNPVSAPYKPLSRREDDS
jgi:hypothetical protein